MNNNQINLSVPYYCQRDNKYIWYMRDKNGIKDISTKKVLAPITCNVTSLCMILHYFGITQGALKIRKISNTILKQPLCAASR